MKVTINYIDETSFNMEEIVSNAKRQYGTGAKVTVSPLSMQPHDIIYFALQQMITTEQLSILYDNKENYHVSIKKLRSDILYKLGELVDSVIIDNEAKVS